MGRGDKRGARVLTLGIGKYICPKSKRSLSSVVTTLIIILLSLVAIGIVWAVVLNLLKSQTEEISLGKFLVDLKLEKSSLVFSSDSISATVKRNVGPGELLAINFILSDETNTEVYKKTTSLRENGYETFVINTTNSNLSLIKSISVVPVLKTTSGGETSGNIVNTIQFTNIEAVKNINGLVSWWRFEGNVNDEMGRNNGVANNVSFVEDAEKGKVASFNGVNASILVNHNNNLNFGTESFSYSVWINSSLTRDDLVAFSKSTGVYSGKGWNLIPARDTLYGGYIEVLVSPGINDPNNLLKFGGGAKAKINDSLWHNLIVIIDRNSGSGSLYIDSVLFRNSLSLPPLVTPTSDFDTTNPLYIGRTGSGFYFNGSLDNVMIFNRTLNAGEIKAIYNLNLN